MPVGSQLTHKFKIEINGGPVAPDVEQAMVSAVVDENLHLPDVFEVTYRDPARDILDRTGVRIGGELRVLVFSPDDPTGEPLLTGEVTAVEASFDRQGTLTVIRGSDKSHRLQRGRTTESYTNVTYADVAAKVADRLGLKAEVESTSPVHDHVSQFDESDWTFLWRLARPIGFEVVVLDGALHFRKPTLAREGPGASTLAGSDPLTLTYGADLTRLSASVTASEQVGQVEVRGWDMTQKTAVVGTAPAETTSAQIGTNPIELAGRFDSPTFVHGRSAPIDPGQVDAMAVAVAEQIAGTFAELDGTARGNPKLRAGTAVSLSLVKEPFDGRYTVSRARHLYDPHQGYTVDFSVSGRQDRSLLGLSGGEPSRRINGVVVAVVTDAQDPETLGRVKLRFPWLSETYESTWARVASAGAGPDRGLVVVPEVGDEVLVAFEDGDPSAPYVLGGLWNGQDAPPAHTVAGTTGEVQTRTFRTRAGAELVFDDDQTSIKLATADGSAVVTLTDSGSPSLTITTTGDVAIESSGKVEIAATGGLALTSDLGVEVTAGTSLKLSGATVDIDGTGPVSVSGTPIKLN